MKAPSEDQGENPNYHQKSNEENDSDSAAQDLKHRVSPLVFPYLTRGESPLFRKVSAPFCCDVAGPREAITGAWYAERQRANRPR